MPLNEDARLNPFLANVAAAYTLKLYYLSQASYIYVFNFLDEEIYYVR